MKIFSSLFVLLSVVTAQAGVHLFILPGQSNMAGLDPKVSFIPAVEKEFGKDQVIVVKSALGGQPIRRWFKEWKPTGGEAPENNGDLYDKLGKDGKGKRDDLHDTKEGYRILGERFAKEAIALIK